MPIHQVTHVNHVDEEALPEKAPSVDALDVLSPLAAAEARETKKRFFRTNPKLLKEEAQLVQLTFDRVRNRLGDAEREEQAKRFKEAANLLLTGKDSPRAALFGYLVGVWYLRGGRPSFPMFVAHAIAQSKHEDAEAAVELSDVGAWLRGGPAGAEAGSGAAEALRTSLHLNAAAAALRLSLWAAARAACELVLAREPTNAKALFRLAKAHEGEGEIKEAISTLVALAKHDRSNGDARRLIDELRRRQAEERARFKALFAGAAGDGPDDDSSASGPTAPPGSSGEHAGTSQDT